MKKEWIILMGLAFGFSGCVSYEDDPYCKKYTFMTFDELRGSVVIKAPQEIKKAGKIYTYGEILLVNEANVGIHVIDNRDKTNPQSKAFISLKGNVDIAVKEGFLYADSFMDLVVFDIHDVENIKVVKRVNDTFNYDENQVINGDDKYRCNYDTLKGVVVGAEQ